MNRLAEIAEYGYERILERWLVFAHIDRVAQVTGSHDHAAIGTDLDGWIKPALPGLEHLGRMRYVQDALAAKYGTEVAEKISSGNVLALLRRAWR